MSDNNDKEQEIPYSNSDDPGYSAEDSGIYINDNFNGSEIAFVDDAGWDSSLNVTHSSIGGLDDTAIDSGGSTRELWTDEKEEQLKVNLIDFVSSFHRGKPSLGRSNLLMGMAGELELPFEHKLMDAIYELGEYKKIVGYPALVQFMNNLGYFGFAEPDLDPALDPTYDPGHITADDVRRFNDRLPEEIKSDPEQMKRYRDNEIATEISEKLSESEISRDEVEGLIAKFNSENSAIFYRIILDSVLNGEIPRGHYRYFDEHDPVAFADGVIKESKGLNPTAPESSTDESPADESSGGGSTRARFDSDSYGDDDHLAANGFSGKNGFAQSARKHPGGGVADRADPAHDRNPSLKGHPQPSSHGNGVPFHKPFDLTEALVSSGMAVLTTPFVLMGGVGAIYNASAKGSYNKLLSSKISAMESSQASIKSTMEAIKSGVGVNGSPLSDVERDSLLKGMDENVKCYRNRIRDISDMSSSKHLDEASGKKIHDAMAESKSFIDEMSKDDSEIAKKYKEIMENMMRVVDMIMKLFESKKDVGEPSPG